jgi:hypothetical protein
MKKILVADYFIPSVQKKKMKDQLVDAFMADIAPAPYF